MIRTMAHAFDDLVFESTRTMAQPDFPAWVDARSRWQPGHYELLNGSVVMTPPAGYPHGEIASRIQGLLGPFVRARKLGRVFDSSQGFELPSGDTIEPDASFVSNARWSAGPPPEEGKFLRVVPDLVVEILSATTASRDRGEKRAIYERNGVGEYWLVDWRTREVTVLLLGDGRYGQERVHAFADRIEAEVVPGLVVPVAEVLGD
jgi:Uma2 family endonuclease